MKLPLVLALLLANHGYWIGGQDQQVTVQGDTEPGGPAARVEWHLAFNEKKIAEGVLPVHFAGGLAHIDMRLPPVKERTELQLTCSFPAAIEGAPVHNERVPVHLFPDGLITNRSDAAAGKTFVVLDEGTHITEFLARAKVSSTRLKTTSRLELLAPDVLLVGTEMLSRSTESVILDQVQRGANVLIFAQHAGQPLGEYKFAARLRPAAFLWRGEHDLFRSLSESELQSLVEDAPEDLACLELPADSPVLVLSSWPPETPRKDADQTGPIDALMATMMIGQGRLVILQLPLTNWERDPRAQILLNNALGYLLTRPEPTPRPSERFPSPATKPVPSQVENRIPFEEK